MSLPAMAATEDEDLSARELLQLVSADEPGNLLVCPVCGCKRFAPGGWESDTYTLLEPVRGFKLLHASTCHAVAR